MTLEKTTFSTFFKLENKSKIAEIRAALASQKENLLFNVAVPWDQLEEKIAEKIIECFNINLATLFVSGWKKYHELQQFADSNKYRPGEKNEVPLLEHEIVSEHHPALEISLGGIRAGPRIEFDLTATLELQGAVLTIQDGKIIKVLLSKCKGTANLKWNEITLANVESKEVSFGGDWNLSDGIQIQAC
jgi:hypothetical protein